jgi:hypothetical protein
VTGSAALEQLQSWFAEALVHDAGAHPSLLETIVESGPLRATQRLRIYQEAFWIRMKENLEEDYPGLRRLLGAPRFESLVRDFVTASPQGHSSLIRLGEMLPAYLERHFPDRLDLASVARLEWAKIDVRHAGAPSKTLGALPALPPDVLFGIRMVPSPLVRLVVLPCRAGRWLLEADPSKSSIEALPETVMVVRRGFDVHIEPIASPFDRVLVRLVKGASLTEAVGELDPTAVEPAAVTEAFADFLTRGYFERFDL